MLALTNARLMYLETFGVMREGDGSKDHAFSYDMISIFDVDLRKANGLATSYVSKYNLFSRPQPASTY
jgi:hypothetical protein